MWKKRKYMKAQNMQKIIVGSGQSRGRGQKINKNTKF